MGVPHPPSIEPGHPAAATTSRLSLRSRRRRPGRCLAPEDGFAKRSTLPCRGVDSVASANGWLPLVRVVAASPERFPIMGMYVNWHLGAALISDDFHEASVGAVGNHKILGLYAVISILKSDCS